jgi:hypothetical protein
MLIDCDRCAVRGRACSGCVVTVLLGAGRVPSRPDLDAPERAAIAVLAGSGLVPPLRLVPPGVSGAAVGTSGKEGVGEPAGMAGVGEPAGTAGVRETTGMREEVGTVGADGPTPVPRRRRFPDRPAGSDRWGSRRSGANRRRAG